MHPAPPPRARLSGDAALVLITLFWGVTFVVVKDALAQGDALSFLALRFGVGALALTPLAGRTLLDPRNLRHGALLAGFLWAGFLLQTLGLERTTPSRSAFITGLAVVFVPLLAWVVSRRATSWASAAGVALAALGLFLLTRPDADGTGGFGAGEWLTLGCALAYAVHIVLTEKVAPRDGRSVVGLVAVQLWGVALLCAVCLPFTAPRVAWTPGFVGAFVFCGLFASALAICVQTWGQARTTAVRAAVIYALEPVSASALSVALGREVLGPRAWVGGALILLGVLVAELGGVLFTRRAAVE